MVEIACSAIPGLSRRRGLKKGTSAATRSTPCERFEGTLRPRRRLFFLIGADAFDEFETWKAMAGAVS